MKKLKVSEKKALWEALVNKHYNHEFPKLYRVSFNKQGMVRNAGRGYAEMHFPTLVRMFHGEVERLEKERTK
jgi:hypothetical protein